MTYKNAKQLLHLIMLNIEHEKKLTSEEEWPLIKFKTYKKSNQIVGILYGLIKNNVYYIDEVFVNEEYRKQGIATQLIGEAIKEAKENDCSLIFIYLLPYEGKYLLENILNSYHFEYVGISELYKMYQLQL